MKSGQFKITRVEITNYRSCLRTSFEPTNSLSVLIGVNGSGKSNVLNALLLLKGRGQQRFGPKESFLSSECRMSVSFQLKNQLIKRQSVIRFSTDDRNRDEVLGVNEKWILQGKKNWIEIPFELVDDRYGRYYYSVSAASRRELLYTRNALRHWLPKGIRINEAEFQQIRQVNILSQDISYYSASRFTDPSKCPSSFEIDDEDSLRRPYGTHDHIQFVYDLYLGYRSASSEYNEFISIVGGKGIGLIDSIRFKEIDAPSKVIEVKAGGKVVRKKRATLLVIPSIRVGKTRLSPNQLSEGTFKALALIYYILTDKSKILLIEEPEVCVHHGLLSTIIELLKSNSRKKQIIISTHSDFVLDKVDPEQVFMVLNTPNGTTVKRISKFLSASNFKALKDYLQGFGNLGEFWRHGGLER